MLIGAGMIWGSIISKELMESLGVGGGIAAGVMFSIIHSDNFEYRSYSKKYARDIGAYQKVVEKIIDAGDPYPVKSKQNMSDKEKEEILFGVVYGFNKAAIDE